MNTYEETIDFLNEQLPAFSKIGVDAFKKGLGNITEICNYLNNPQNEFPCIHIAGTNGKGSTSHLIAGILQECGYKVGLYTSPHLIDIRERFRINGQMVSKESVVDFVEKIKPVITKVNPSYFELNVAMAFQIFADEEVDIAVIETGLGGRLDSTNIINPILSIITNIGLDHTHLLGNTIEEIALEKAGIIKSYTPVLIGESQTQTDKIFTQQAISKNAPLYFADHYWAMTQTGKDTASQYLKAIDLHTQEIHSLSTDLLGSFQQKNIKTALTSMKLLKDLGFNLTLEKALESFKKVKLETGLKGRWETIGKDPLIIIDVAHNPAGISLIMENLHELRKDKKGKLNIILGFVKDKDVNVVLDLFPKDANYNFTKAQIIRAIDQNELRNMAAEKKLIGESYASVTQALENVLNNTTKDDIVLITGSFFIVGEAITALSEINRKQHLS